ncbi:DUF1659 domain-containing protein [Lacticaseibacillus hegangensis]|uniref:DUF1659 domain-containing protein n=1 Tax=Lacticaseibacillus hegangensis TaxID=2486010 RepID=A0ABW4CYZ7_9LACO|nr:DUF1659 domain-containing protein [Lacticaseibacillus hegangensis]
MVKQLRKRSLRITLKSGTDPALKTINFSNIKQKDDQALLDFADEIAKLTPPYGETTPTRITLIERNKEIMDTNSERIAKYRESFFEAAPDATEEQWTNWMIMYHIDMYHPVTVEQQAARELKEFFIQSWVRWYEMTPEEALEYYVLDYSTDIEERYAYWLIFHDQAKKAHPELTEEQLQWTWLVDLGWGINAWGEVDYREKGLG